jgi:hypothetical protein
MITNLKVQIEEELKEQLEERDRIIGNLEAEIVTLRKDLQEKNMQNNPKVWTWIQSDIKGIKLQNNKTINISKKLCRKNQRG